MSDKRVLVTGAAGFIGSHIVDRFLDEGLPVDGVDNLSSGDLQNLESAKGRDFRLFINDFASHDVLRRVIRGEYDTVCHVAAMPRVLLSVQQPLKSNDNNVTSSLELMDACRGNIKRFVFSSSSSVYGNTSVLPTPEVHVKHPQSPYALQKSIIEDYCRLFHELYGMESICLRYFNVFGPRSKGTDAYATAVAAWLYAIKNGTQLRSDGDGEQSRDLCYVENVVQANYLAMIADNSQGLPFAGRCYNVACGHAYSNNQILEFLEQEFGKLDIVHAPERAGDVKHTCASIDRITYELGYSEPVSFWEGLELTIAHMGL